jgi:hypothetical protein
VVIRMNSTASSDVSSESCSAPILSIISSVVGFLLFIISEGLLLNHLPVVLLLHLLNLNREG